MYWIFFRHLYFLLLFFGILLANMYLLTLRIRMILKSIKSPTSIRVSEIFNNIVPPEFRLQFFRYNRRCDLVSFQFFPTNPIAIFLYNHNF